MAENLVRERTLEEVRDSLVAEAQRIFGAELDVSNPRTPEYLLISLLAAKEHANDRLVNRGIRSLLPTQATGAFLDALGVELGVRRRPATPASGEVLFTGVSGTNIPVGTVLVANGIEFTTDFAASLDTNGQAVVNVTAQSNGPDGNVSSDTTEIVLQTADADITDTDILAAFVGGGDAEDDDAYRIRILQRSRAPTAGGNKADWEGWALALPNVRAVRVYDPPAGGPGHPLRGV